MDGKNPDTLGEPGALDYIHEGLNGWSHKFDGRHIPEPCRRERTFWFALYQLEELVENSVQGGLDPYERVLLEDLAIVKELLRGWSELPEKFYAIRPGEMSAGAL